jgi:hypothetical protein
LNAAEIENIKFYCICVNFSDFRVFGAEVLLKFNNRQLLKNYKDEVTRRAYFALFTVKAATKQKVFCCRKHLLSEEIEKDSGRNFSESFST